MLFKRFKSRVLVVPVILLLSACVSVPDNVTPVQLFDTDRYLGRWYEIARLDHRFERGLSNVRAEYALLDNGDIEVINTGFNDAEGEWQKAVGKAKLAGEPNEGFLKVSFFGPFYGNYVVFELDEAYQNAYVAGDEDSYLWYLSRTLEVSEAQLQTFIEKARELGYPVDELIIVEHDREAPEDL